MSDSDSTVPQNGALFEYGEVRKCACHGMYWRPYSCSPSTGKIIYARGYKNRDTFSGDDWLNDVSFTLDEWRAGAENQKLQAFAAKTSDEKMLLLRELKDAQ